MGSYIVSQSIYAGLRYSVVNKDGKLYIALDRVPHLIARGADPKLLDDIGKQDPEDALAAFFASIPKK